MRRAQRQVPIGLEDYSGYLGRLNLTTAPAAAPRSIVAARHSRRARQKRRRRKSLAWPGDIIQTIDEKPIADAISRHRIPSRKNPARPEHRPRQSLATAAPLTFTAVLTRRPLEVVQPESHDYKLPNGGLKVLPQDPLSLELTLDTIGRKSLQGDGRKRDRRPSLAE